MKTLILKRHSEADLFSKQLTRRGQQDAIAFGHELSSLFRDKTVAVFSSRAQRAIDTAKLIIQGAGLDISAEIRDELYETAEAATVLQGIGRFVPEGVDVGLCVSHGSVVAERVRPFLEKRGISSDLRFVNRHEALLYEVPGWNLVQG